MKRRFHRLCVACMERLHSSMVKGLVLDMSLPFAVLTCTLGTSIAVSLEDTWMKPELEMPRSMMRADAGRGRGPTW